MLYRLSENDAAAINRRREDAIIAGLAAKSTGAVVHTGNHARGGEVFPMVITKIWGIEHTPQSLVQGQVLLDGSDCLWVTSVKQGDDEREWLAES